MTGVARMRQYLEQTIQNIAKLPRVMLLAAGAMVLFHAPLAARADTPALIEAARSGDGSALARLLNAGADPDVRQADGATALHWAVYRKSPDATIALLDAGADVNAVNRLGASPLFVAAEEGNADLIRVLLERGADPNLALPLGETPLMTAARAGTAEGVRLLIAAGADVNARENSRAQTALMWSAAQGHVGVVRALVDAGADLEARSRVRPRLMYADATNGGAFDQGIIEQLGGFSPLLFAARHGHVQAAEVLLSAGAKVDGPAGNGAGPLVIATHSGHPAFSRLLLEHGADPDAIGAGYTAMHAAILRGDLATVEALLSHGADPDRRLLRPNPVQRASEDWALKTPLVGVTPYWIAAYFREAAIMGALVEGGADPLLTNEELWSRPRSRAERDGYTPEVVGGFESAIQAAVKGDSTRDRYYVQSNPDPVREERLTREAVITAIEHGVEINHADFTGSTALHDAAARNLASVVRELAERGADVNRPDGRNLTPLDIAEASAGRRRFFETEALEFTGPSVSDILLEYDAVRTK